MSVISRDCQLGDHGVCSLGFGCVCKCHHPSVDERIGATERQEQARTIEDCHARIAELERQVEELDAKAMAEEMLKNGNYRLYEREKIRAETAETAKTELERQVAARDGIIDSVYECGEFSPASSEPIGSHVRKLKDRAETAEARVKALEGLIVELVNQTKPAEHAYWATIKKLTYVLRDGTNELPSLPESALEQKEGV